MYSPYTHFVQGYENTEKGTSCHLRDPSLTAGRGMVMADANCHMIKITQAWKIWSPECD